MGALYSVGCQTIRTKDYIEFLYATGCVERGDKMADYLQACDIDSSILFRGENAYPTGGATKDMDPQGRRYKQNEKIYGMDGPVDSEGKKARRFYMGLLSAVELKQPNLQTGYYVLDRTHMPGWQKVPFYIYNW